MRRVEDLLTQLPSGAEFEIDHERTVVTVNPPDIVEEPEPTEAAAEAIEMEGEVEAEAAAQPAEDETEGEAGDEE